MTTHETTNAPASSLPMTQGPTPAEASPSAGIYSTSSQTTEKPATQKRINPMASRHLVRDDYHKQVKITYAEAALIAGVSVKTICKWVCKKFIPLAAKKGPYRIDRLDLEKYLRTGIRVT